MPSQPPRPDEAAIDELATLRDWLRYAVSHFGAAGLAFGHGSHNAFDEAAYLILHALHLPFERLEPFLDARLLPEERRAVARILARRIDERLPAAYLTGEAWLGAYRFRVDPRVIVPRSYLAELIEDGMAPWVADPHALGAALELCTGSGCLAILMAHAFPAARIDAIDLSPEALAVARQNVADYALEDRITLVESDLFDALQGRRYDLILANPPYVTEAAMRALPPEYRHEPAMALAAGPDGMDVVRRILAEARRHLAPGGILAVEVGHNRHHVEAAFPGLPATWITARSGDEAVFIVERDGLAA